MARHTRERAVPTVPAGDPGRRAPRPGNPESAAMTENKTKATEAGIGDHSVAVGNGSAFRCDASGGAQ
jgi:hypothetical protein